MADNRIPRRSKRLALRRAAAPAVEAPQPAHKAAIVAPAAQKATPKTTQTKPSPPLPPLNHKQSLFVENYLMSRNATDAAKKAGYSAKSARVQGPYLMSNPAIAAAISKKSERVLEKLEISRERIQLELVRMGLANMADYMQVGANGAPVTDFSNLTRDQAAALQEITVEEFTDGRSDKRQVRRVKFKLADKVKSLVALGQDLGMFTEKHEHRHTVNLVGTLLDEIDSAGRGGPVIEHQAQDKSNG